MKQGFDWKAALAASSQSGDGQDKSKLLWINKNVAMVLLSNEIYSAKVNVRCNHD